MRPALTALIAAVALVLSAAPSAAAQDPGRWLLTGASSVPNPYWQGLTSDPDEANLYFTGVFEGLWRTTPQLHQTAGVPSAIPPAVKQAEGYNHIGDPTWNRAGVVLPLECYDPGGGGNTCGTGSFGVADPATLAWRYYVKLDPAEIPKAMWAETSPDGKLVWTSSGDDLLAYRSHWITPEFEPRRYDTRFFTAQVPAGQRADDRSTEADVAGWMLASDVLRARERGEAMMLPPTLVSVIG